MTDRTWYDSVNGEKSLHQELIDPTRPDLITRAAILHAAAVIRSSMNFVDNEAVDLAIKMYERLKSKGY